MMADYGYPGTWYFAADGRKRRCRTIGGSPCHQHANGGHITEMMLAMSSLRPMKLNWKRNCMPV